MAQTKADFIKVPVAEGSYQTMPVEPEKRIADSDITLKYCDVDDAEFIVSFSLELNILSCKKR